MPSLLTDAEKAELESAITDVFDTFKRLITVYTAPEMVYVSTDPNFSRFGQFGKNNEMDQEVTNNPVTQQVYAIVLYNKNPEFEQFNKDKTGGTYEQIKMKDFKVKVRIRVESAGYEILKNAKKIELDNRLFETDSPPRGHGLFTTTRWDLFYKEIV